jgi:hypothetical protein
MAIRDYFKFAPMPIREKDYYAYSPVDPDNAFTINAHKRASFLLVAKHCATYPVLGDKFYELKTVVEYLRDASRAKKQN